MRDIPGYEGLYAVTEDGRVWSYPKRTAVGRNGGTREDGGRWLNLVRVTNRTAHLRAYLHREGKKIGMLVHRAVALAHIPNPNDLPHINHKDGDPTNNRIENLEWCDAAANARHAVANGLTKMPKQSGTANSQAKVSEDDIVEMRRRHAEGESCASIARAFGIDPKTAWDICNFKRWAHVSQGSGG